MTILLTGTIDTNSCINTKRTNIEDRINDYYNNINKILQDTDLDIVFVENSNHPLGILSQVLSSERVEVLQFSGNTFDRRLGKGHGEWMIINHALENSTKLRTVEYLAKLTGRYSVNFSLLNRVLQEQYVLYRKETNLSEGWAFTGFFKIPKPFWSTYMQNSFISDDPGCYIENVLAQSLVGSRVDITYIDDIGLEGISGTHNIKI